MKTKGRKRSNNIEDKRAYFGTESREAQSFVASSFKRAATFKPQPYNSFTKTTSTRKKKK